MPAPDSNAPSRDILSHDRLAALRSYGILDTAAEDAFDQVVHIAAQVCSAPVALVSLVEAGRQWFKARVGFDVSETPLDQSVCAHGLAEDEMLVIPDLTQDPRTAANPLVVGPPHIRFYAGAIIRTPDGHALGTVCVLDYEPRPDGLTGMQATVLKALATQVAATLETRRSLIRSVDDQIEQARVQRSSDRAALAVKAHELKLSLAVGAAKLGIFDYDLRTGELNWDARVRELFGVAPNAFVDYESAFLAGVHPDDRDATDAAVKAALDASGSGVFDHEYRTVAPDGKLRWLAARGQSVVENGAVVRFVGTVRDVTERRTADDRIAVALERFRLVSRITKDVIRDWDLTSDRIVWNDALVGAYGHRLADIAPTPLWWLENVHDDDRDRVRDDIRRVLDGAELDWSQEYRFRRADGSWADVFDRGSLIRDAAGKPLRMISAMFDNSVRKAEEARQELLNHELSHRMKNILMMVQAIAAQTVRAEGGGEQLQKVLSGRLVALGKAHDILLSGATDGAGLAAIIEDAVRLHLDAPGRVTAAGPNLDVGPRAALPIVLMVHELSTNAAKYGALSNDRGRVDIRWSIEPRPEGEVVILNWTERDGPPVAAPGRQGFGTKLIERGLAGQLGAKVSLAYPPDGATCTLEIPRATLTTMD